MPIVGKILQCLHRPLRVGLATIEVHLLCTFWLSSFSSLQTCSPQCCFCSHSLVDFLKDQTIRLRCSWCGVFRYASVCVKTFSVILFIAGRTLHLTCIWIWYLKLFFSILFYLFSFHTVSLPSFIFISFFQSFYILQPQLYVGGAMHESSISIIK